MIIIIIKDGFRLGNSVGLQWRHHTAAETLCESTIKKLYLVCATGFCSSKPADVIFALDTSNSIWYADFLKQLDFVRDVTAIFTVGRENIMVGVLTYAENPRLQFNLNYYTSKKDLAAAIGNIRQDGGYVTRTADALRYIRERSLRDEAGARRNVTKVRDARRKMMVFRGRFMQEWVPQIVKKSAN